MPLPQKVPDRRVQRTHEVLLEALRELLIECGYEDLTIQNIIDRAGISRATFYAHFESKDDLLRSSIGGLREYLTHVPSGMARERLGFTRVLFEHLASHRSIYLLTVCREHEVTVERVFRVMLCDLVRSEITARAQPTPEEALAVQHFVGALWSTIVWWMGEGQALSPAEVDVRFRRLSLPGVDALLSPAATR